MMGMMMVLSLGWLLVLLIVDYAVILCNYLERRARPDAMPYVRVCVWVLADENRSEIECVRSRGGWGGWLSLSLSPPQLSTTPD
jgi:hypothetical protein